MTGMFCRAGASAAGAGRQDLPAGQGNLVAEARNVSADGVFGAAGVVNHTAGRGILSAGTRNMPAKARRAAWWPSAGQCLRGLGTFFQKNQSVLKFYV